MGGALGISVTFRLLISEVCTKLSVELGCSITSKVCGSKRSGMESIQKISKSYGDRFIMRGSVQKSLSSKEERLSVYRMV